ncbi:MAG: dimethylsulfonioproprionate lyase family protein [Pseudomonadota bacterium]
MTNTTSLKPLFLALADALNGPIEIEKMGREAFLKHSNEAIVDPTQSTPLAEDIQSVLAAPDAHPACRELAIAPLPWAPPITTDDPAYIEVSKKKALVELIGPAGIVQNNEIRMGVYGISKHVEYGIRTHPAEEVFVMIAGRVDWLMGDETYAEYGPGVRRHHLSMVPHATRTRNSAFMSIYVWTGDVSFEKYDFVGAPARH